VALAVLVGMLWLPVGWHFWRAWRTRGNFLSLAILCNVAFALLTTVTSALVVVDRPADNRVVVGSVLMVCGSVAALHLWALHWNKHKFSNERRDP